nr:unnamed protein product [Hydra vulgaris]
RTQLGEWSRLFSTTAKMLTRYKQWVYENKLNENVESLKKFIVEEADFQNAATETLHGFKIKILKKDGKQLRKSCTYTHNRLLHNKRHQNELISEDFKEKDTVIENSHTSNIQFHSNYVMNNISLRTVPVILGNGNKKVMEKINKRNLGDGWYLPHFPILRPDKSTTKVRIVFDGSAKYNSKSINDVIYQGPKLQQDLVFRKYPVALACDIEEM